VATSWIRAQIGQLAGLSDLSAGEPLPGPAGADPSATDALAGATPRSHRSMWLKDKKIWIASATSAKREPNLLFV